MAEQIYGEESVPLHQQRGDGGPIEVASAQPVHADQQWSIRRPAEVGVVHQAVGFQEVGGGPLPRTVRHAIEATGGMARTDRTPVPTSPRSRAGAG